MHHLLHIQSEIYQKHHLTGEVIVLNIMKQGEVRLPQYHVTREVIVPKYHIPVNVTVPQYHIKRKVIVPKLQITGEVRVVLSQTMIIILL